MLVTNDNMALKEDSMAQCNAQNDQVKYFVICSVTVNSFSNCDKCILCSINIKYLCIYLFICTSV